MITYGFMVCGSCLAIIDLVKPYFGSKVSGWLVCLFFLHAVLIVPNLAVLIIRSRDRRKNAQ